MRRENPGPPSRAECESRGLGPFPIIHRTASRLHTVRPQAVTQAPVPTKRLFAVRYPDILHLRGMVEKPSAFALFDAKPVDGPAFIAEDLLEIPHRQRLRRNATGLACKRPDCVDVVMFRQHFQ